MTTEQPQREHLLQIEDLTRVFTIRRGLSSTRFLAVDRVSLSLQAARPEIVAVVGESGSGKTTLARMILGLVAPSSGRLIFKGRDVTALSPHERRSWFMREIQPIFQDPFAAFSPLKRVESYLYETAYNLGGATRAGADARVDQALTAVGLSLREVKGRYPNELSGGQLQRTAIARALITSPSLLVADEPVSMLDASLRMSIVNSFRELKEQQGVSVIYITHDLATAYYAADRIAVMLRGWVVEQGTVEQVLGSPKHPYTQILKSSVPQPDPALKWQGKVSLARPEAEEYLQAGCKFAGRCPMVMDICRQVEPQSVPAGGQLVKCHLYDTSLPPAARAGDRASIPLQPAG
ncbi:MAG TPA: ABC transporter ATP-binding protein [Roseiflexaceae bacterium]|nr:ABC transporter ATP-binding protein [Roseiflexaceae bacterium]